MGTRSSENPGSVDLTYKTFSCGAGPSNRRIPQAGAGPVSCNGLLAGRVGTKPRYDGIDVVQESR